MLTLTLLRGTLDLLVLRALSWGPQHGYAISEWIRETTQGAFQLEEGTLYPALHRLERKGLVRADWGRSDNNRRARFYELTAAGRDQLEVEADTWNRYVEAMSLTLRNNVPGPGGDR